jgi:hypothetical protein
MAKSANSAGNLFSALGNANKEKIHSEFLCWFFNLPPETISDEQKSQVMQKLFLDKCPKVLTNFRAFTEVKSIDIIITSNEAAFVIENKLKSSEHLRKLSSADQKEYNLPEQCYQTVLYQAIFKKLEESEETRDLFKRKKQYFAFLTLLGEMPQNDEWNSITYTLLVAAMQGLTLGGSIKEYVFIREYIDCVQELAGTWKTFQEEYIDNNVTKYNKTVFGGKPKKYSISRTDGSDPVSDYINKFALQTIFQRGVYLKLVRYVLQRRYHKFTGYISDVNIKESDGSYKYSDKWSYSIDESQGTAFIQINVQYFNDGKKKFVFGFQQQGNSVKINCAVIPYAQSKKNLIEPYESIFKECAKNHPQFRVNYGKSKAYISMSTSDFKIVDKTFEELYGEFIKKFEEAREIIAELDRLRIKRQ